MQSNKASKKTRKDADGTATSAPEVGTGAEMTSKPRSSRSSKPKKTESAETGSVRHRNAGTALVSETTRTESAPLARAATAAFGAEYQDVASAVIDPVGVVASEQDNTAVRPALSDRPQVSYAAIAELAHSYWIARGYAHGHAEEDWLRAEKELTGNRS